MFYLVYFLNFFLLNSVGNAAELPSYFPTCCILDPELDQCLTNAINSMRLFLKKGIDEVDLPSFNPYVIPEVNTVVNTTFMQYNLTLWNETFYGMDDYQFRYIRYDPETLTLTGTVQYNSIPLVLGTYAIHKGNMLSIPLEGEGSFDGKLIGPITASFVVTGKIIIRNKEEYFSPTGIKVTIEFNDMFMYLKGISGGTAQEKHTNYLLNKNSKLIMMNATPEFEKLVETLMLGYIKQFTAKIPYNKIFPCGY